MITYEEFKDIADDITMLDRTFTDNISSRVTHYDVQVDNETQLVTVVGYDANDIAIVKVGGIEDEDVAREYMRELLLHHDSSIMRPTNDMVDLDDGEEEGQEGSNESIINSRIMTFREFIEEAAIPLATIKNSLKIASYQGIDSYITSHAIDQGVERNVSTDTIKTLINRALKYTKEKAIEVGKTKEVLFYSKSLKQGIIASYRRDNPNIKTKYLFIVTVLPKHKSRPRKGTHKIMVESITYNFDHYVELD